MKKIKSLWRIDCEELQHLFDTLPTRKEILKKLNENVYEGNYEILKQLCKKYNICLEKHNILYKKYWYTNCQIKLSKAIPKEEYFVKNVERSTTNTKSRFIKEFGVKEECQECGVGNVYNNKPLVLHLDHIDGDNKNNTPENLRLLCPNCHSQTKTYAGRNNKKKKFIFCINCKKEISYGPSCAKCMGKKNRKFDPSKEELEQDIQKMTISDVARKYKVSRSSIKKRCKVFNIAI
jgi:hypothetical protein